MTPALAAMIRAAARVGENKKVVSIALAIERGEFDGASISEALAIAQFRWAKTREEMAHVAMIWGRCF